MSNEVDMEKIRWSKVENPNKWETSKIEERMLPYIIITVDGIIQSISWFDAIIELD